MTGVQSLTAANPGPFTLAGTNTYVVGSSRVAVIDPGPDLPEHRASVVERVASADSVVILLTHDHADHIGGTGALGSRLRTESRGPGGDLPVRDGDRFGTDAGVLVALSTPGHTMEHYCYHLVDADAVFVGDLLLGEGDTTWIGEYRGGVGDYLRSLDLLEQLGPGRLYPGHGPVIDDPLPRIDRFRKHRTERIDQVRAALNTAPDASLEDLVVSVYPELPPNLRSAARYSVQAIVDYLADGG
ncbi:MAG: MBL fold metallo-hydrolase [Longimicrobiales bacterium]